MTVTLPVTNTGGRDGDEVVQCYVGYPDSKVEHPQKQLKAFERVAVKAGETREVKLTIDRADLTHWDEATHRFEAEKGRIQLMIGASSADIRTEISFEVK